MGSGAARANEESPKACLGAFRVLGVENVKAIRNINTVD